jgi:hypothetical protein
VHLDAKWPLIRHCIESKNLREDQYRINHSFDVGLSGYLVDQQTFAGIASCHITT